MFDNILSKIISNKQKKTKNENFQDKLVLNPIQNPPNNRGHYDSLGPSLRGSAYPFFIQNQGLSLLAPSPSTLFFLFFFLCSCCWVCLQYKVTLLVSGDH